MGIKEKILMIITIILLVIMIVMACYNLYNKQEDSNKDSNIINEIDLNETTKTNTEEVENETVTENVTNNNTEPTIQPNVTENEINSDYIGTEEQETTNNVQTEEEKVIELVKNEYGTDQGVSFNIANKDGNIYHVSVNDTNTTAVIAWYSVDISTNTVTQQ